MILFGSSFNGYSWYASFSKAEHVIFDTLGVSFKLSISVGMNLAAVSGFETTWGWNSQILLKTQLMPSLIFLRGSVVIAMRFSKAEEIVSINFCFSGPSVIDPRAMRAEYFCFQLIYYILAAT